MGAAILRGLAFVTAATLVSLTAVARFAPLEAPEARLVLPGTVVLDAHGTVLEHEGGDGLRIPVTLEAIAPRMLQATISAEDRRFQRHVGIDPLAIARAATTAGTQRSGASTITQQLARRLYLADDASPLALRKAHEALIALELEGRRSKADILDLYLNDVYYGHQAYGVEAAARVYFGISARNLDLAHAAYLAGLPQRPSAYDPASDPAPARARQAYVLARMLEDGWITRAVADAAAAQPTDGDPAHGGDINMTLALRSPGSALKPFLYAAAFEHGFTPATALLDVPSSFASPDGPYTPLNYDRTFHGVVPLRVALASSLNVPAVRTLDALGGTGALLEIPHPFELPFPAAAKSGTSTGARDTWTLGYTPEVAIGVWVGNANGEPLYDVAGIEGAGPIWRDAMMAAALGRRMSWYARPPGVIEATVCAPTGLLPGPDCPSPVRELFASGTVPNSGERYYSRDADGRVVIDPPLEARTWAHDAGLPLRGERRPGDSTLRGLDGRLRIVSPVSGSIFFIAAELAQQRLVLRAAADPGIDRVTFEVDGQVVGEVAGADPQLVWTLQPGRHSLRASARLLDGGTAATTATFEVKARCAASRGSGAPAGSVRRSRPWSSCRSSSAPSSLATAAGASRSSCPSRSASRSRRAATRSRASLP